MVRAALTGEMIQALGEEGIRSRDTAFRIPVSKVARIG